MSTEVKGSTKLDRLCTPDEANELFDGLINEHAQNKGVAVKIKAGWLRAYMVREFHRICHEQMRQDIFCKVVRKIYGESQKSFAESIGFSTKFVADIERGKYPDFDDIDTLCRFEEAVAGFFLLRNSGFDYDCADDGFDEESVEFVQEVKELHNSLNIEREKIYAEDFKKLPKGIQDAIKKSGKRYVG